MNQKESKELDNSDNLVLKLTRWFDAPPALVFEVWTKKEHLVQWLAPKGFTISFCEGDLQIGGAWRSGMVSPTGEEHWVSGVYREIMENELLVFTHAWDEEGKRGHETIVTVRFSEEGNKTKLTFEQKFFQSVESRDGHKGGWSECFEKLSYYLLKFQTQ